MPSHVSLWNLSFNLTRYFGTRGGERCLFFDGAFCLGLFRKHKWVHRKENTDKAACCSAFRSDPSMWVMSHDSSVPRVVSGVYTADVHSDGRSWVWPARVSSQVLSLCIRVVFCRSSTALFPFFHTLSAEVAEYIY